MDDLLPEEPLAALDFSKFSFIPEFQSPRSADQVFERASELLELQVEDLFIKTSPTIPTIPTMFTADLLQGLVRRIVQYPVSPKTRIQFESDMIQANCSNIEAMVFLQDERDPLSITGSCARFNVYELVRIAKERTNGLVGIELNNPYRHKSLYDQHTWSRAADVGADFLKINNVWSEKDIINSVEAAVVVGIPLLLTIQIPKGLSHLRLLTDSGGVVVSDEYLTLFKDVERDGMFNKIAVKEAVRLLNLCEIASAGAVVSADFSQLRYLRENGFGQKGCKQ